MTHADWHDVIVTACVTGFMVVLALVIGWGAGWLEGSLSLRIVPPWKRRASEPKARAAIAPAAGAGADAMASVRDAASAPAAVPIDGRRAS